MILDLVGNTPLIRLIETENFFKLKTPIYAKLELFNPTGSVKDRAALYIVANLKRKNKISCGDEIVTVSSGNFGVSLALVAKKWGYKPVIIVPKSTSHQKIKMIKAYGGTVFIQGETIKEGINFAKQYAKSPNFKGVYIDQFKDRFNVLSHYKTTAEEIIKDCPQINYLFAGIGSGGTIMGTLKGLKKYKSVKGFAVLPKIKEGKNTIEGIGAGFIPPLIDKSLIHKTLYCDYKAAKAYTKILADKEGLLCGLSSGAVYYAAIKCLKKIKRAKNAVIIFPDSAKNYSLGELYDC